MRFELLTQEQEERQKVLNPRRQRIDAMERAKSKIGGYVCEFVPPCAICQCTLESPDELSMVRQRVAWKYRQK